MNQETTLQYQCTIIEVTGIEVDYAFRKKIAKGVSVAYDSDTTHPPASILAQLPVPVWGDKPAASHAWPTPLAGT